MRILGVLIVILGIAAAVLIVVMRRVVAPALRRRNITQLYRDVFVNNVGYSEAYTNAIEAKQVQVQAALAAQAKVAQARAEAEQAVAQAKGEAEAISLRGKALHNNPEVLRLEAIDKLNPNDQVIICTGQTCPSFLPSGLTTGK
jgi:cytochrome c-type biogenesis protein CcmH/NrfG